MPVKQDDARKADLANYPGLLLGACRLSDGIVSGASRMNQRCPTVPEACHPTLPSRSRAKIVALSLLVPGKMI